MANNKNKKKGKKSLSDLTERPSVHKRDYDPYYYKGPFRQRKLDEELIERIKKFEWHPRRCYMAYDWEYDRICIFFPELIMEGEMFHYLELPLMKVGSPLAVPKEIKEILKKARKSGRRRRAI
jgi:hypothetical protein